MNIQLVIECYANSRSKPRCLLDLLNVAVTAGMRLVWEVCSYKVKIHRGDQFGGSQSLLPACIWLELDLAFFSTLQYVFSLTLLLSFFSKDCFTLLRKGSVADRSTLTSI